MCAAGPLPTATVSLLEQVTAESEQAAPRETVLKLYSELLKREEPQVAEELAKWLARRLEHKSIDVKVKTLNIMLGLQQQCPPDLKRKMGKHCLSKLRSLVTFSAPPHPEHADKPMRMVQQTAATLAEALKPAGISTKSMVLVLAVCVAVVAAVAGNAHPGMQLGTCRIGSWLQFPCVIARASDAYVAAAMAGNDGPVPPALEPGSLLPPPPPPPPGLKEGEEDEGDEEVPSSDLTYEQIQKAMERYERGDVAGMVGALEQQQHRMLVHTLAGRLDRESFESYMNLALSKPVWTPSLQHPPRYATSQHEPEQTLCYLAGGQAGAGFVSCTFERSCEFSSCLSLK